MTEGSRFWSDGRLAARLGRLSWVVLVTGFVVLISSSLGPLQRDLAVLALASVVLVLNLPTARGVITLWRAGNRSQRLRVLLFLLGMRAVGLLIAVVLLRSG